MFKGGTNNRVPEKKKKESSSTAASRPLSAMREKSDDAAVDADVTTTASENIPARSSKGRALNPPTYFDPSELPKAPKKRGTRTSQYQTLLKWDGF
jgi:hypothetical protein